MKNILFEFKIVTVVKRIAKNQQFYNLKKGK